MPKLHELVHLKAFVDFFPLGYRVEYHHHFLRRLLLFLAQLFSQVVKLKILLVLGTQVLDLHFSVVSLQSFLQCLEFEVHIKQLPIAVIIITHVMQIEYLNNLHTGIDLLEFFQ